MHRDISRGNTESISPTVIHSPRPSLPSGRGSIRFPMIGIRRNIMSTIPFFTLENLVFLHPPVVETHIRLDKTVRSIHNIPFGKRRSHLTMHIFEVPSSSMVRVILSVCFVFEDLELAERTLPPRSFQVIRGRKKLENHQILVGEHFQYG